MVERLVIRRKVGLTERRVPSTSSQVGQSNRPERSPTQSEFLFTEFRSQICREQFELDLLHRSVMLSKTVNFKGWESLEIKEMFDKISLQGVYSVRGKSCDRIVRLFYTNMSFTERSGIIKTNILSTEICITLETVNELIGFTGERADRYYHASWNCHFIETAEGTEFIRQIHQKSDIVGFIKPISRYLNVKARVVHNMVSHTILPWHGHRDLVSYMDLYVMKKLYSGRMFDPGFVILSHMCEYQ